MEILQPFWSFPSFRDVRFTLLGQFSVSTVDLLRSKLPLFCLKIGETKGCDPVKHPLITREAGILSWVTLHALFQA